MSLVHSATLRDTSVLSWLWVIVTSPRYCFFKDLFVLGCFHPSLPLTSFPATTTKKNTNNISCKRCLSVFAYHFICGMIGQICNFIHYIKYNKIKCEKGEGVWILSEATTCDSLLPTPMGLLSTWLAHYFKNDGLIKKKLWTTFFSEDFKM